MAPNPAFAAQLRRRLADLLEPSPTPMRPRHAGLRLRPYLVVDGADAAIAFYAEVFGARVVGDLIRGDDGRVGHSELAIGGGSFFLADAYPEYGIPAPDPAVGVALHLEVADADATVARAAAAGATVLQPVEDRFYGSRSGTVRDPFGHQWQIDAPGTVGTTQEERDQEMADGGYAYETVDLGERAMPTPPTRTEMAAANASAPGRRLLHDRRARPRPGGRLLRRPVRLGGASRAARGSTSRTSRRRAASTASAEEPGVTLFIRVPDVRAAGQGPRARGHRAGRGGPPFRRQRPLPRRPRRARSSSGSPLPATDPGSRMDGSDPSSAAEPVPSFRGCSSAGRAVAF